MAKRRSIPMEVRTQDDYETKACRRLAKAVIVRAIVDMNIETSRSLSAQERDGARAFLAAGAPGWAEAANISSTMIAGKYPR